MFKKTPSTHSPCSIQRHSAVQQLPAKTQLFALKTHWHSCATTQGEGASIIGPYTVVRKGWGRRNDQCVSEQQRERGARTGVWEVSRRVNPAAAPASRGTEWPAVPEQLRRNLPEEAHTLSFPTFPVAVTSSSSSAETMQSLGMWGRSK